MNKTGTTYWYQVVNEDGSPGRTYKARQSRDEPPFEVWAETGEKVKRVASTLFGLLPIDARRCNCGHGTPGPNTKLNVGPL